MVNHTPQILPTELSPVENHPVTSDGAQSFTSTMSGWRAAHKFQPRCHVCKASDDVYEEIHQLANNGATPAAIGSMMRHAGVDLNNKQIRAHLMKHVPGYANYAAAVSSVSRTFGGDEFPGRVTGLHASQIIIERGTRLLAEGRVELKARDIIAAARFQHEIEAGIQSVADASSYATFVEVIMGKFYYAIGPARFNAVMTAISSDPKMIEIMTRTGMSPAAVIAKEIERDPVKDLIKTL